MKRVGAIFRRDLIAYFKSPVGYIILAVFAIIFGILFSSEILFGGQSDIGANLLFMQFMLIIIVPIITMRGFTEDRKSGTDVLLLTSPASIFEVVIGKFLASFTLLLIMTSSTLIHLFMTLGFGGVVDAKTLGAYIGFIFIGAAYLSIGLFASSLTENQLISFITTFGIILALFLLSLIASLMGTLTSTLISKINIFDLSDIQIDNIAKKVTEVINWPNPSTKLDNFSSGIFELTPIVYFVSIVSIFIFLTIRMIEKRRWTQK
ncbi:MAG: ABC transporter permease [Eubacteriales bacterium]|nr:ABC transporter permease [Eubacteriales bacterium]MDD4716916.1 ABC transporter permease [Eubacteriales bacterium]